MWLPAGRLSAVTDDLEGEDAALANGNGMGVRP
jgi:hypothetical protein